MLAALLLSLLPPQTPKSIELDMRMRGGMPAVEVQVNGEGPFLFAIDTGAQGDGRADASLVKRLDLPVLGQVGGGDGSGRSTPMNLVGIDHLELGGLAFEGLQLPSRDYNQRAELGHIDGILGYGLFAGGVLTLDYPAKKVRFEPGTALPEPDGKSVLAYPAGSTPSLEIRIGERSVRAVIDSGNLAGRFIFPESLVKELTATAEPRVVGHARTVTSEIEMKVVPIAETLRIGQFEFPAEEISYPPPGPVANVGSLVLQGFCVSFDARNGRVRLVRP